MNLLTLEERDQLRQWLLELKIMADPQTRLLLLEDLPNALKMFIPYSDIPWTHISIIINYTDTAATQFDQGTWAILCVLHAAIQMTAGFDIQKNFRELKQTLIDRAARKQLGSPAPSGGDLSSIQALQHQLTADLLYLRRIQATVSIRPNPGWARLSSVIRIYSLENLVLAKLRELSPRAPALSILGDEATIWLDIARRLAAAACDAMKRCYHLIDMLVTMLVSTPLDTTNLNALLRDASTAAMEACQNSQELCDHMDNLIKKHPPSEQKDTNHTGVLPDTSIESGGNA